MADHEKRRILLIDDDTSLLVTLGDFLSFEGYDVVTANSGEKGLERLRDITPDLIILDMSMPGMGGVGFLKKISTAGGKPKHPVLVLTARANMAEFFANVEVDGFVAKPCNPEDLLMEVSRIIFLRRGTEEETAEGAERVSAKVLIAEDEPGVRSQIVDHFRKAGYLVDSVSSGPEVLEKAIIERPDVLLMKRLLTGMNGDAVAGVLKEIPTTRGIPVVLYDSGNQHVSEAKYTQPGTGISVFLRSDNPLELMEAAQNVLGG